jgi:plastocyanin
MGSSKGSFFLICLLISSTIFSSILLSLWTKPVFGEGLSASLGNRSADFLIKMIPAIVTTESLQNGQKPAMSGSNASMSGTNSSMSPVGTAGTNATSVSIVKGASNPSTQEPYNPSPLNVAVGRTVLWTNNDNAAHTVTEGNPSGNTPSNGFDSGILSPGQTFKHAFDKPGKVGYYCTLHPFMLGRVIVK